MLCIALSSMCSALHELECGSCAYRLLHETKFSPLHWTATIKSLNPADLVMCLVRP